MLLHTLVESLISTELRYKITFGKATFRTKVAFRKVVFGAKVAFQKVILVEAGDEALELGDEVVQVVAPVVGDVALGVKLHAP